MECTQSGNLYLPNLLAHKARIAAQPKGQEALTEEGLLEAE